MLNEKTSSPTNFSINFQQVFASLPGIHLLLEADGPYPVVAVSDGFISFLNTNEKKDSFLNKSLFQIFTATNEQNTGFEENLKTAFQKAIREKKEQTIPSCQFPGVNNATAFSIIIKPVIDDAGLVAQLLFSAQQVTSELTVNKETTFLNSHEEVNALLLHAPVAVCIVSGPDFNVELVNEGMLQFMGRTIAIKNKPIKEVFPEAEQQGLIAILESVYKTGKTYYAYNFAASIIIDGVREARYFDLIFKLYRHNPLKPEEKSIFCVAHNITEQVLTRKKIEESEEELKRFKFMADNAKDPFILMREDGTFAYVNKMARAAWGYEEDEILNLKVFDVIPMQSQEKYAELFAAAQKQNLPQLETQHKRKDGSVYPVETNIVGLTFGGHPYLFAIARDITERKKFDSALKQSEADLQKRVEERTTELESLNNELKASNVNLEEFAYAASHDLKEPIRKIHYFSDRLMQRMEGKLNEEEQSIFLRMELATKRMSTLIDDLLNYSHVSQGVAALEAIDLNKKVQNVLEDLELAINENEATVNVSPLPSVMGHRRQLQQLFQNLIGNALKYHKPDVSPVVTISSKMVKGTDSGIKVSAADMQKPFYLIEVKDNGIGFEQKEAERIFNVFTRLHGNAEYKGTGVGLSIVKKVVENHKGYIAVTSSPGSGATFSVLLPAGVA